MAETASANCHSLFHYEIKLAERCTMQKLPCCVLAFMNLILNSLLRLFFTSIDLWNWNTCRPFKKIFQLGA